MSVYLYPIQVAIILFPFLAALITLPYVIQQYRHYGAVLMMRVVLVYSFIFYLLCSYFLVILPLPLIEDVALYTTPIMQLIPFHSLQEFTLTTSFVWDDPSTYWSALNEPSLFQILFNIAMTIPFGVYLRYYFQCGWKKTFLLSFLLTLSFETLQLSGLLGIYPRPYRLFDVDDLITNTLGGMIGYLITPLLVHFLPTRKQLDTHAYEKGLDVSAFRRIFAFLCDIMIVLMIAYVIHRRIQLYDFGNGYVMTSLTWYGAYGLSVFLYLCIMPILFRGRTLGKWLVKIQLKRTTSEPAKWYQYTLYYVVLYFIILPAPFLLFVMIIELLSITLPYEPAIIAAGIVYFLCYLAGLMLLLVSLFAKEYIPWFRAKLVNISTVEHADETLHNAQEEHDAAIGRDDAESNVSCKGDDASQADV